MHFADRTVEAKYLRLGFEPTPLGLELRIGRVRLSAAGHPWKGVVLIFTSFEPRTMIQFDVAVPTICSTEQIAALIYTNFVLALREHAAECKRHFENLEIPVFQ